MCDERGKVTSSAYHVEKRLYRERAGGESEWEKLPTRRLLNTTSVRA